MSAVSPRCPRKLLSGLGLMASASILSMVVAGEVQAQCVVTSPSGAALNNVPTFGTVECSGVSNNETIITNGFSIDVNVTPGSTMNNGNVVINGIDTQVYFGQIGGAATTVSDLSLSTSSGATLTDVRFFNADATNIDVQISGQQSNLRFLNGSAVVAAPNDIFLVGGTNSVGIGGNGILAMENSSLTAAGPINGFFLLNTGAGNESVVLFGSSVTTLSDGLLIATGDGNDLIQLTGTTLAGGGASGQIIDGGNDNDEIRFSSGSGATSYHVQVGNVESATFTSGAIPMLISGSGSYDAVSFTGGSVQFDELAALGLSNATVSLSASSLVILNENTAYSFNQTLSGTGTIRQNTGDYTFNGNSTGFTGRYEINGGTTTLTTNDALGTADIANDSTLLIGDLIIANDISGAGSVTKTGSGTARLTGNNTFSGLLDIQGGSLEVGSVNNLGEAEVSSTSPGGAILVIGNSVDETLDNDVTGNLVLVKDGAGVLTLTGSNSYTLGTLINAGAVRVDDFARLGTGQVIANSQGSLILDYNGAGQLLQTTAFLTGSGAFIKEGTGDVVMSQTSTYAGGTTIRAGRIGLNNGNALGAGAIQVDAGATLGIGNITLANTVTGAGSIIKTASGQATVTGDNSGFAGLFDVQDGGVEITDGRAVGTGDLGIAAGSFVFVNSAGDTTIAADISGAGDLENFSNTRLTLSGNNSLSGVVFVSNGTLQIEGSQNVGTATIQLVGSSSLLDLSTAGSTTLSNNVLGNGGVVKTGSGTVFMTGANTYAGGTDIQQGAIRVTDTSFLGTGAITVQAGAALDLSIAGPQSLNQAISGAGLLRKSDQGDLTLLGNGLTGGLDVVGGRVIVNTAAAIGGGPVTLAADTQLVFDTAGTETMGNTISGAGALTKDGAGVLVIQNANAYTGGTVINAGRLGLNSGQGLGTGSVLVMQGAQLSIGGVTLANEISGAGQVLKTSNNVGSLTGINSHTGGTDIQGGTLLVNSTAALGNGAVTMAAGTFLDIDYNGASNVTLNNVVSGAGTLIKDGTGTVIVTGANSYTGGTAINAGRLGINTGSALGTGGVTVNSGAELAIGDVTLANAVTGTGRVIKTSAGNTALTGANTFSGGLELLGGNLTAASVGSLGTGAIALAGGSSLSVGNAASQTLGNALSGAGALVKIGTGIMEINSANTYSGGTTITAGRLTLGSGSGLGAGGVTIANGAELALGNITLANVVSGAGRVIKTGSGSAVLSGNNSHSGGTDIQGGDLAVSSVTALGTGAVNTASGAALRVGNATAQTLGLALTGAGSLIKSNTGDLTVTNNALTGGLTISAGRVLATGGATGTGSGAVAISAGAELAYTAVSDATFANGLSGAGTFRKLGAGRLLFSNPGSIGSLLVDAGSVRINSTLTGNATVASGARLDGTGQVTGTLTNNGTVAPGNSIGTLNVQGNYVHGANSVLEIEFDGSGGIDLLAVTGSATLNGGTLRFISTTGAEGSGGTFMTAAGGVTGTFATVETVGAQLPLAVIYQPNSAIMAPSVLTARPSTFNAQTLAGADTTLTFIEAMGLTDMRHGSGNRVWLGGLGAWGSRSATASTLAYSHDVAGLAGGVNLAVGGDVTVGAAIAWASGDITLGSNGGGGEQSTVLGALTVRYANTADSGAPRLGAGVVYGRIDQDTVRNVAFNGFSASVEGATQSDVLAGFAEAAVPLGEQGAWTFAANGRAAYVHLSQDGYTESGNSPLRLQLDDLGSSTVEAEGLLSANINLIDGGFAAEDSPERLALRFDLGARYLAALGDREIPVRFAASNAGVTLQGDTRDIMQAVGGLGLTYTTRSNLSVGVGYRAEIGQRDNHAVRATISLGF